MKLYKKNFYRLGLLTWLAVVCITVSCSKPFENVNAILSNNYIQNRVSVQITDVNPLAPNPYPAAAVVTLSGEAVEQGLIYTDDGTRLTSLAGSAVVVRNTLSLAIKPYTIITDSAPIKFTIYVEAAGYLSTSKEVTVTSIDAIKYEDLKMLKLNAVPDGVAVKKSTFTDLSGGVSRQSTVINVPSVTKGSSLPSASITIPSGTAFKDISGTTISNSNELVVNLVNFSNLTAESVSSIPGGIANVSTSTNTNTFFTLAGALDVTAFLGATAIKTFTNPFQANIYLDPTAFNPKTLSEYKEGDNIDVWSKDAGSAIWNKESSSAVTKEVSTNRLKVGLSITHLSIWMAANTAEACGSKLRINYSSNTSTINSHFITIRTEGSKGQLLASEKVILKNGSYVDFAVPKNLNYVVSLYAGSSAEGVLLQEVNASACATSVNLSYQQADAIPSLYFDLETSCSNGVFRYTGPIAYKLKGSTKWLVFTPAESGKLTTSLLEWDKTYDFRIIYKNTEFSRSRQVLQTEFRKNGNIWEYWGKDTAKKQTFFNTPTSCN